MWVPEMWTWVTRLWGKCIYPTGHQWPNPLLFMSLLSQIFVSGSENWQIHDIFAGNNLSVIILFFPFFMCVWYVHVSPWYIHVYMHLFLCGLGCMCTVCMHVCMNVSEGSSWCWQSPLATLVLHSLKEGLSIDPTAGMTALADQLALGIPSLPSKAWLTGRQPWLPSTELDFWGKEVGALRFAPQALVLRHIPAPYSLTHSFKPCV